MDVHAPQHVRELRGQVLHFIMESFPRPADHPYSFILAFAGKSASGKVITIVDDQVQKIGLSGMDALASSPCLDAAQSHAGVRTLRG
jgi:hypothetical protein